MRCVVKIITTLQSVKYKEDKNLFPFTQHREKSFLSLYSLLIAMEQRYGTASWIFMGVCVKSTNIVLLDMRSFLLYLSSIKVNTTTLKLNWLTTASAIILLKAECI